MAQLAVVAATARAIGDIASGNSRATASLNQAHAFEYQAQQDRYRAQAEYQQGNQNEESQRRMADRQLGQARAAAAQSGTGLDGSNADIIQQSATDAELDALNIRYQADLRGRGALAQADMDQFSANMKRSESKLQRFGGWMNAGASALSGAKNGGYGGGQS